MTACSPQKRERRGRPGWVLLVTLLSSVSCSGSSASAPGAAVVAGAGSLSTGAAGASGALASGGAGTGDDGGIPNSADTGGSSGLGAGGLLPSGGGAGLALGPFQTKLQNFDAMGRQLTRFDTLGNALDAHDGEIAFFDGLYYLYGTSYDCGYQWGTPGAPFCGFKAYSSPDLVHFTDRGALFDASTPTWQKRCNGSTYGCYRPHVVFNAKTRQYVLWVNVYDNRVGFRVFTSPSPSGPYTEAAEPTLAVNGDAPVAGLNSGDHDTFVDDDGVAYVALTDWRTNGTLAIERLDASYLSGTGDVVRGITPGNTEAPALFKRDGIYYLAYSDPNCGYCSGTGTSYRSAPAPLGPWSAAQKISADSCGGQPSFVSPIALSDGTAYLYASDLWNHAARNEALANFFWAPLEFAADGSIAPIVCQKSVPLSLAVGAAGSQVIAPSLDNSAGVLGFAWFCDIRSGIQRAQSFVAKRSGTLSAASFTTFQDGAVSAGLTLAIRQANDSQQPTGVALFSSVVPAARVGYAPKILTVTPNVQVVAGTRYSLVVSSASPGGCFGLEYDDHPETSQGGAAYSNDSGQTFEAEAGRTLKFETTITP